MAQVFGIDDLPLPWKYSKTDGCLITGDGQPIDWSLDADVFDEVKKFEAKAINNYARMRDALRKIAKAAPEPKPGKCEAITLSASEMARIARAALADH